jgi:aldehyde:ferredoxin oxidoreductase
MPYVGKNEAKNISFACIDPAGERLARIVCIINDKSRAAGRGGHGAVWGSKNPKAIAVYGNMKPLVASKDRLEEVAMKSLEIIKRSPVTW